MNGECGDGNERPLAVTDQWSSLVGPCPIPMDEEAT